MKKINFIIFIFITGLFIMPTVINAAPKPCTGIKQTIFTTTTYEEITINCENTTHTCDTIDADLWNTIKSTFSYNVGFPYCKSKTPEGKDIYNNPIISTKVVTEEQAKNIHKVKFEAKKYKKPDLQKEVSKIYNWGIGLVGVLAFVMITYGGILYMVSGAVDQKSKAKGIITDALIGLFLALSSFLIIGGINESLTILKPPELKSVETIKPPEAPPKKETPYESKGSEPQCVAYAQMQSLANQGHKCKVAPEGSLNCPTGNMNTNPQGSYICTPPAEGE